jgi:hypothetical protein
MLNGAKITRITLAILFSACCLLGLQLEARGKALHLQNHSVKVSTSIISAVANYDFTFTYPSAGVVGSVVFQYCDSGALIDMPCNAPAGLDTSSASLVSQTGNVGFSIDTLNSTANKIVLTRVPAAAATIPSAYSFDNITNPSTPNATTYVRITTYASMDGTGPNTDDGAVAFATVSPFEVSAVVPPYLKLCVGIVVTDNCSTVSGDNLDLGVLSATSSKFGTSEFSAGTNSFTGYNIYTLGTTMTSGNNIIPAINPAGSSQAGISQFGLNLRANTKPPVGEDPQGAGTGAPIAGYNTSNIFKFQNGENIVSSSSSTDFSKMTVSYVVNINNNQPPGIYSTTVTYLAVGNF